MQRRSRLLCLSQSIIAVGCARLGSSFCASDIWVPVSDGRTTSLSSVLFNDGLYVVVDICFASFLYLRLAEHVIAAGGGSEQGRGKGRIALARDV